jgi:hypothetical protein
MSLSNSQTAATSGREQFRSVKGGKPPQGFEEVWE